MLKRLLNLLWPRRCVFCKKEQAEGLCEVCHDKWLLCNEREAVLYVGKTRCICTVRYKREARDAIRRYKFRGKYIYNEPIGRMMSESLAMYGGSYTCVTWVPLSKKRQRQRGYDQCRPLAESVARSLGLPLCELLVKTRHNRSQNGLKTDAERAGNVNGAFDVKSIESVKGQDILLIDDIVTSGATLMQTVNLLLRSGVRSVECAVFARSR